MTSLDANVEQDSRPAPFVWFAVTSLLTAVLAVAVYTGHRGVENSEAESTLLARQLAVATNEADTLTENVSGLRGTIVDMSSHISVLEAETQAGRSDIKDLEDQLATLRSRLGSVRLDAREAVAEADAARIAKEQAQRVGAAALVYANASADLSSTRNQMIDLCNDTMTAAMAGLSTRAVNLERQYNALVPVHNRQLAAANTALGQLRNALRD